VDRDYDPAVLPVITDNDVGSLEFERRGLEDLASEITVRYTDRDSYKPATLALINPAVENMLGYTKSESYDFMAVTHQDTAMDILKRLLLKEAYPYATVKFTTSLELFRFSGGGGGHICNGQHKGVHPPAKPGNLLHLGGRVHHEGKILRCLPGDAQHIGGVFPL